MLCHFDLFRLTQVNGHAYRVYRPLVTHLNWDLIFIVIAPWHIRKESLSSFRKISIEFICIVLWTHFCRLTPGLYVFTWNLRHTPGNLKVINQLRCLLVFIEINLWFFSLLWSKLTCLHKCRPNLDKFITFAYITFFLFYFIIIFFFFFVFLFFWIPCCTYVDGDSRCCSQMEHHAKWNLGYIWCVVRGRKFVTGYILAMKS